MLVGRNGVGRDDNDSSGRIAHLIELGVIIVRRGGQLAGKFETKKKMRGPRKGATKEQLIHEGIVSAFLKWATSIIL